mmetsp:Transcript_5661/g.15023  ORF Transcript_5661/g.15023 Transcript_5661/m.15023 type:complete len:93 (-) Transcript_5661:363-641(-)
MPQPRSPIRIPTKCIWKLDHGALPCVGQRYHNRQGMATVLVGRGANIATTSSTGSAEFKGVETIARTFKSRLLLREEHGSSCLVDAGHGSII